MKRNVCRSIQTTVV